MYDNLNDASKSSGKQLAGYITLLQVIIIEFNFFLCSLMLTIVLIYFFCFENMYSVGFMSIFLLLLRLLLLKIIMRGNHVPTTGSLGRHYQCRRIGSV